MHTFMYIYIYICNIHSTYIWYGTGKQGRHKRGIRQTPVWTYAEYVQVHSNMSFGQLFGFWGPFRKLIWTAVKTYVGKAPDTEYPFSAYPFRAFGRLEKRRARGLGPGGSFATGQRHSRPRYPYHDGRALLLHAVLYCCLGVCEGSREGNCEGNSAACASVRSEKQMTRFS